MGITNSDARCFPLIEVDLEQIRALLSPLLTGTAIASAERVEGGLVNTLFHIRLADGGMTLCLRIFAAGMHSWETERKILARVSPSLPVPHLLLAECNRPGFSHPYLVYKWITGITLDECRRQMPPVAFLSLAGPLGRLLAKISSFSFPVDGNCAPNAISAGTSHIETVLLVNEEMLQRGLARSRLGTALADTLWRRLVASADRLCALDQFTSLVHGDLGGRNILVAPGDGNNWCVSGLIDWEASFSGSSLWDVGRLFRYARRYTESFRDQFERSYRDAGGNLPEDWWQTGRLLDSTRLVGILNEEQELPTVFAECRELIEAVVAEGS